MGGALSETPDHVRPMLSVVGIGTRVMVDEALFQRAIDEDRELACRRNDRLGLADAEGDASVKRAECGLGATQGHRCESKDGWSPVGRWLGATAQEATTRHLVVRREREPGREVFLVGPPGHVEPDFL